MTPISRIVIFEQDTELISFVSSKLISSRKYDVVICDKPLSCLQPPNYQGVKVAFFGLAQLSSFGQILTSILEKKPASPTIILMLRERGLSRALKVIDMCDGFVFIDHNLDIVSEIVDLAVEGYCAIPTGLFPTVMSNRLRLDLLESLSPEEHEILVLLGHAFTNRAIAQYLKCFEPRVKNLVRSVLRKMRFRNRTEAGVFALRHGITDALYQPAKRDMAITIRV